jgi:glycosyltransferase involved in cell wall biosynthesis
MQKTNFRFEVIVQDDASTDDSQKIIKDFANKYNFIVPVLHTENIYSKGGNINEYFFKNAKGKYIALCEGDDYWTDPYKLQKQVDFLENNTEYSFCASRYRIINERSQLIGEGPTLDLRLDQNNYEQLNHFENYTLSSYLDYPYNIFQYSTVMFRHYPDITQNMDKNIFAGDLILSVSLLTKGHAYFFVNEYFSAYRIHSSGVWNRNNKLQKAKIKLNDYSFLIKLFPEYKQKLNEIRRIISAEISEEYAKVGNLVFSLYYFFKSILGKNRIIKQKNTQRMLKLFYYFNLSYSKKRIIN